MERKMSSGPILLKNPVIQNYIPADMEREREREKWKEKKSEKIAESNQKKK